MRTRLLGAIVAGALASLLIVAGAVAAKPASPRPYQQGDHVWSSNPPSPDGIATKSEPAELGTLPDAPLPAPVRPYRVGDKVWLTTPPVVQLPALAVGSARKADVGGLSNVGEPVEVAQLSPRAIEGFQRAGGTGILSRLGERAGTTFFAGSSFAEGKFCFATADAAVRGPLKFSLVACQGAEGTFPSAEAPLADFSPRRGNDPVNPADEEVQILRLAGFAADGVAQVGVIAVDGSVYTTPVVDNIYASNEVPASQARAIVALDGNGKTIHTIDLITG